MKLGPRQQAIVDLLKQGYYISIFEELCPHKRTVRLMDEDGDEVQMVRDSLVSSLIKRGVCKWEMVYSTVQPDTETLKVTLK